jgi:hypothetical protein
LADVGGVALPGVQEIGAHGAGALALGTEHVAVDGKRLLVAEQPGDIGLTVLTLETVVAAHIAAGRQGAALGSDALDVAPQLDLLGEECRSGGAVLGAFVGDPNGVVARQRHGRGQGLDFAVHHTILHLPRKNYRAPVRALSIW